MDANKMLEDLSRAVAATKPAQEYCFAGCQHWSMCMTKSEWAGWMQAIGAILAIFISVAIAGYVSKRSERELYKKSLEDQEQLVFSAARVVLTAANIMADARDEFFQSRSDIESPRRLSASLWSQIILLECLINKPIISEALSSLNYVHGCATKMAHLMDDLVASRSSPNDRDIPFISSDPDGCKAAGLRLVRIRSRLRYELLQIGGKLSPESIWENEK